MTREEAFQEFWDNAMHPSLKPNISEAAKAMAMAALKEPERGHGRWIPTQNPNWKAYSHDQCSVCGWWNTKNALCYYGKPQKGHSLRYCPNCGAKMDEE